MAHKQNVYNWNIPQADLPLFSIDIEDAWDYVQLIYNTIEFCKMHIGNKEATKKGDGALKIYRGKVCRLIVLIDSSKYISVYFPFNIVVDSKKRKLVLYGENGKIDDNVISGIKRVLLNSIDKTTHNRLPFSDVLKMDDSTDPIPPLSYALVEKLLFTEFGYIRYDHDVQQVNGDVHPEFHLDINCSKLSTYKMGLKSELALNEFEMIFDKDAKCVFPLLSIDTIYEFYKKTKRLWNSLVRR